MGTVTTLENLKYLKNSKSSVALCHGVFDVLHDGHLSYIEEAKKLSQVVVVSVTSDRYVNKGPGRPYFSEQVRARMLAAMEIVDYVIINDEPRATNVIKALGPKYYVKGQDYKDASKDLTQGIVEETDAVISVGGETIYTDRPTHSSSTLINKFFNYFTQEQTENIARINELGGIDKITEIFKDIEKYRVTVVGEPIVDTYVFCEPEGISSKSPSISARYLNEENYAGGSLAIANHLCDFVRSVTLYAPHGKELYYQDIKKKQVDKRVLYTEFLYPSYTTPRKTRYLDSDKNQRIFELTNISQNLWDTNRGGVFWDHVRHSSKESHATIMCDFGHGLFVNSQLRDEPIDWSTLENFVAVNCQTNSSNFGFNPFTKHKGYNYLSLDLREARIAFHDKQSDARSLFGKIKGPKVSMTLGSSGALYKEPYGENNPTDFTCKAPAYTDKVIDAVGAGDAYYAITSLLVRAGAPAEMVPFIGNVFAGLKTKIIGNKSSVTKAQLFKAINSILK